MNIIKTKYFSDQFHKLQKKYPQILKDIDYFEKNIAFEPFSSLWDNLYKFRIQNSSIPVWKRSGFRVIIFFLNTDTAIPLLIYSKNEKTNASGTEIKQAKKQILKELTH